jgi:DNA-binding LacI/PurR family transcriptional regulator
MAKSITIRDVAAKAGVAVSTVSRTLSCARLLRSKATNMFGLIVREIEDPFFAQLIKALRSAAKERGFELVIGYAEADPTEALRISELMMDMRYSDGLFLVGDLHEAPEDLSLLERMGWNIPLVLVSRGSSQLVGDYPFISTDNRAGTRMASFTIPRLTTVRQPVDLLSRWAVELLDGLIKGSPVISHPDLHISLMPELIVRESCAPV